MKEILITSSVLILLITAVRYIFRDRISRRLQYALWALVALRLLLPFSLPGASFSVLSGVEKLEARWSEPQAVVTLPQTMIPAISEPLPPDVTVNISDVIGAYTPQPPAAEQKAVDWSVVLRYVWWGGAAVMAAWFLFVNFSFSRRLKKSRTPYETDMVPLPVYLTDAVVTPCLFGLFRPAIYLTPRAVRDEETLQHVLTHETCHWVHGDHLISALRCLCLCIYWFDPLVWLAAFLSRADGELACDEAVIRTLGSHRRLAYGKTLVDMIAPGHSPSGIFCAATTMISGKKSIRQRVLRIAKNKKTLLWAAAIVVLLTAVGVGITFTAAKGAPGDDEPPVEYPIIERVEEDLSAQKQEDYWYCRTPEIQLSTKEATSAVKGAVIQFVGNIAEDVALGEKDGLPVTYTLDYDVMCATEEVLSIQWLFSVTTQVESGFPVTYYAQNFDARTGQQYTFNGLFRDPAAARALFVEKARNALSAMEGSEAYTLTEDWYEKADTGLSFWDFYMTEDALHVFWQQDVVGPYLDVHYTWEELEELLAEEPLYIDAAYDEKLDWMGAELTLIQNGTETPVTIPESLLYQILRGGYASAKSYNDLSPADWDYAFRIREYTASQGNYDYYFYRLPDSTAVRRGFQSGRANAIDPKFMRWMEDAAGITPKGMTELDAAVRAAILSPVRVDPGQFAAEHHVTLATWESGSETTVYVMVFYQVFSLRDGKLENDGESEHQPMALTFRNDGSGYVVQERWEPNRRDYTASIREKFPDALEERALDTQSFAVPQLQQLHAQANAHFGIDPTQQVAAAIDRIVSATEKAGKLDYDTVDDRFVLYSGDWSVTYILSQFLTADPSEARAQVLWHYLHAIYPGEIVPLESPFVSYRYSFEEWRDYEVRLADLNGPTWYADNRTVTILMTLLGKAGGTSAADLLSFERTVTGGHYGTAHDGDLLTYEITVMNPTSSRVSGAAVRDRVPAGTSLSTVDGRPVNGGDSVEWTVDLAPGETRVLRYAVKVGGAPGTVIRADGCTVAGRSLPALITTVIGGEGTRLYDLAVSGLTAETSAGVVVKTDYVDEEKIVFHGSFGVFVYDLKKKEITMAVDLLKAVGTRDLQGGSVADVRVSPDGKTLRLCRMDGIDPHGDACRIDLESWKVTYTPLAQMDAAKIPYGSGGVSGRTLGELVYTRGVNTWKLFTF